MWKSIAVCLIGILSTAQAKSPYKYSFDPLRAEEVLAGLSGRPRLMDKDWLNIIGEKKVEKYTVSSGDNLWTISGRLFRDPFLWRKLWEVNPFLSNPHSLNIGEVLNYYNGNRGPASEAGEIRIPLIKLVPDAAGALSDLENDSFLNTEISNQFRPSLFILTPDDEILGTLTGAQTDRETLLTHEHLYLKPLKPGFKIGKKFTVIRQERTFRDRTQPGSPILGTLTRLLGEVTLVERMEKHWRAEITATYAPMYRGDELIAHRAPISWDVDLEPPDSLQGRIVLGEQPEFNFFVEGQLVLLNKGKDAGFKEGQIFRVWSDVDPHTGLQTEVEPESKGEVRVVYAGPLSSLGYILKSREPLQVGDTLVPRQTFADPPPPPKPNYDALEID